VVTRQLQVERRTRKVRRPKTDVLPLCHATNDTHHNTSQPLLRRSNNSQLEYTVPGCDDVCRITRDTLKVLQSHVFRAQLATKSSVVGADDVDDLLVAVDVQHVILARVRQSSFTAFRSFNNSATVAEMGDRLAIIDMGRKLGALCPFLGDLG